MQTYHLHSYSLKANPLFANLRRFKDGRRFKQWTGDDTRALAKVIIILHSLSWVSQTATGFSVER
jgi:hypothetical protein